VQKGEEKGGQLHISFSCIQLQLEAVQFKSRRKN